MLHYENKTPYSIRYFDISNILGETISHQNLDLKLGDNTFELPIKEATGFYFIQLLDRNKVIFVGKTVIF